MDAVLRDYGWTGVLILFVLRDVWPWLRKRFDKSADSEAALKEAQLARDSAREERSIKAMENMAAAVNGIERLIASVNVRLEVIERRLDLPTPEEPKTQPRKR